MLLKKFYYFNILMSIFNHVDKKVIERAKVELNEYHLLSYIIKTLFWIILQKKKDKNMQRKIFA